MGIRARHCVFAISAILTPLPSLAQQTQDQRATLTCNVDGNDHTFNVFRNITTDPGNATLESEIGPWVISLWGTRQDCGSASLEACCSIAGAAGPPDAAPFGGGNNSGPAPKPPKKPKPKPAAPLPPDQQPQQPA